MAKPFKPGFFSNLSGVKDNNDRPPLAGGSGGAGTFVNLGTGQGQVFKQVLLDEVQFRTLRAGSGVTITQDANEVTISASGGGGAGTSKNLKWSEFEDFVGWDTSATSNRFFIPNSNGTGATTTQTNNHSYNVRGLTGHVLMESGTTSTGWGQIRSNDDATQSTFSPGGKVSGAARFYIEQLPNLNATLGLILYGESATGTVAGTAMIRLAANLVGVNNWTITIATTDAGHTPQVIDTGIPIDQTAAIQEIELSFNDSTQTVSAVINGTAVSYASTYSASQIQGLITSNVVTHLPFRFGIFADGNANSTEARVIADYVALGIDLTGATGTGVRRPFTLF